MFQPAPKITRTNLSQKEKDDLHNKFMSVLNSSCNIGDIYQFINELKCIIKKKNDEYTIRHIKQIICNKYPNIFPDSLIKLNDELCDFCVKRNTNGENMYECVYWVKYSYNLRNTEFKFGLSVGRKTVNYFLCITNNAPEAQYKCELGRNGWILSNNSEGYVYEPDNSYTFNDSDFYDEKSNDKWIIESVNIQKILDIYPTVSPYTLALWIFTCFGKPNYIDVFGITK